jgi:hypothetical protein
MQHLRPILDWAGSAKEESFHRLAKLFLRQLIQM